MNFVNLLWKKISYFVNVYQDKFVNFVIWSLEKIANFVIQQKNIVELGTLNGKVYGFKTPPPFEICVFIRL